MKRQILYLALPLIVIAALSGGCITSYSQPPKTAPHATLEVDLLPSVDPDVREVRATLIQVDGVPVRWVHSRYRLATGQRTLVWALVTLRQEHTPWPLKVLLDIKGEKVDDQDNLRAHTSVVTNTVVVETNRSYYFDGVDTHRVGNDP